MAARKTKKKPKKNKPIESGIVLATWDIIKLKQHPLQAEVFSDLSDQEIQDLANRLEKVQKDRIDILPDGTTICGHQRVRAAKLLGWKTIDVRVRYDLEAEGPEAVERELIEDNLVRRHLDPLARARAFKHLYEREQAQEDSEGLAERTESVRDRLGERFGLSGRTIDRYLNALEAPMAVQEAFSAGELPLTMAARVHSLSKAIQKEIATAIQAGKDPKATVAQYLTKEDDQTGKALDLALEKRLRTLEQQLGKVSTVPTGSVEVLRRLELRIEGLLGQSSNGTLEESSDESEDLDWEAIKEECRIDLE